MYFKQILDERYGCASYMVASRQSREAAIVDPSLDMGPYEALLGERDFQLRYVIETHVHADHLSGARQLAAKHGASLCLYESAPVAYPYCPLREGEELELGPLRLRVWHTPGHRPELLSLLISNPPRSPEPSMVLTGDSLLVGDVGRPDFAGGDPAAQFESLRSLLQLPDWVAVFPGHFEGPCGRGMCGRPSTTIGFERLYNPLARLDRDAFISTLTSGLPARPLNMTAIEATNRGVAQVPWAMLTTVSTVQEIDVDTLELRSAETIVLDVREPEEYKHGHVPGAINLPQADLASRLDEIPHDCPLVLICRSGARSLRAAQFLRQVGFEQVTNVRGGTEAWQTAGKRLALGDRWADKFRVIEAEVEVTDMQRGKPISPPADRVTEKVLSLPKDPVMIVHQEHPWNVGAPPACVRQTFLTPKERFFVRNHGSVPEVNVQRYRLSVTGMVHLPLNLSLDELRAKFPVSTVMATLQCAGHRRKELAALQPIPGEIPWGAETMSTAVWRGVPLREVLLAAGIAPGARHVAFLGLDEIERGGEQFGFGGSIPIEKAMSARTLLAYEMNGEPLPLLHGFPLRVIVPGYIGARSVKWVTNINVQAHPSTNYFQAHAYKLFPAHVQAEHADWTKGQMLGELPLNAVICHPQEGETLAAGPIRIEGYAITGAGGHIEQVELSVDEGATWTNATLLEKSSPWTWRFWEATLNLPPGTYQIAVRAWDSVGRTQPKDARQIWNCKGYLNNAWHRVKLSIQERTRS